MMDDAWPAHGGDELHDLEQDFAVLCAEIERMIEGPFRRLQLYDPQRDERSMRDRMRNLDPSLKAALLHDSPVATALRLIAREDLVGWTDIYDLEDPDQDWDAVVRRIEMKDRKERRRTPAPGN